MKKLAPIIIFFAIVLGILTARFESKGKQILGSQTSSSRRLSLSNASTEDSTGLKMAFFSPALVYLHIIHDMGAHFFDYGLDPYNESSEIGKEDYEWIERAFNTAVVGYPGPGINDIPTKATIRAAAERNVRVIIAGGDFSYIAQKIAANPNVSNIIGWRIFDEFVPPTCEKRRYPASYPGLGPPCALAEFITEGQQLLAKIHGEVRQYSDVPLMLDFIPVELAYSADNPARWAAERPGNSNAALTGYLQTCAIDHLLLALGADEKVKGGLSIKEKIAKARELWGQVSCQNGRTKKVGIGLRYAGGFDQDRFADFSSGELLIADITNAVEQAVAAGVDSIDIYPWRHLTTSLDRKTLDLVWLDPSCTDKNNPDCAYTGASNPYYEALVNLYQGAREMNLTAEEKATATDVNIYTGLTQSLTCAFGFNCPEAR